MTEPIRSIAQAFAIIRLLAETGPMTLSEVGRSLGVSPSSCLNLLRSLVDEGVLQRQEGSKRYRLTDDWAAADLFQADRSAQAIERWRPAMAQAASEFTATIGLWKVAPGRRLHLIAHVESNAQMRIHLADGQRQPLGGGAVGRALAAAQGVTDVELARRFGEVKWHRPMALAQYTEEVRDAGRQGYAIDDGLAFAGVCSVAVALRASFSEFCMSASIFSGSRSHVAVESLGTGLAKIASRTVQAHSRASGAP